jgi:hypothetical protein
MMTVTGPTAGRPITACKPRLPAEIHAALAQYFAHRRVRQVVERRIEFDGYRPHESCRLPHRYHDRSHADGHRRFMGGAERAARHDQVLDFFHQQRAHRNRVLDVWIEMGGVRRAPAARGGIMNIDGITRHGDRVRESGGLDDVLLREASCLQLWRRIPTTYARCPFVQ